MDPRLIGSGGCVKGFGMEERGCLSIWLGNTPSLEWLDESIEVRFDDPESDEVDGFVEAPFMAGFDISDYEPGFVAVTRFETPPQDIRGFLVGLGDEEELERRLEVSRMPVAPVDSRVAIFHYRHTGRSEWSVDGNEMFYFGISYFRDFTA